MQNTTREVCGTNTCVNPEIVDGGVLVTSTIPGNEGFVKFTFEEWVAFGRQVKDGEWDNTFAEAAKGAGAVPINA